MLKNVKKKNEQIINQHFQEVFGEDYIVETNWGMPIVNMTITFNKEGKKSIWKLNFNMENEAYELSTYATKIEGDAELPDWATIDKNLIEFVIRRTTEISENLFFTREVPEQPASAPVNKETPNSEPVVEEATIKE